MSIVHLIELQEIDSQLDDLDSLLGDLPKMVDELNAQENSLISKVEEDKKRSKDLNLSLSKSETANKTIQEKINKLTDQLFLVTNNKQYDALTLEIDHLKEKKEDYESQIIAHIEESEELEKNIGENEQTLSELKTDLDVRRKKLESALFIVDRPERSIMNLMSPTDMKGYKTPEWKPGAEIAEAFRNVGFPGHRFLDGMSRSGRRPEKNFNYVVYPTNDPDMIKITNPPQSLLD